MGWGSSVAVSCGIGCRHSLDPALLWLWDRPAAAAPIHSLASDLPHASGAGAALKRQKKKIQGHRKENILGWGDVRWQLSPHWSPASCLTHWKSFFTLSPARPSPPGLLPTIYFCSRSWHLFVRFPPLCDHHSLPSMAFEAPVISPWLHSLLSQPPIWGWSSSYGPCSFARPSFAGCVALGKRLNCSVPHTVHL